MTLREMLNLSYVPRWAVVPMLRPQSVADHSWRVAVIANELAFRMRGSSDYGSLPGTSVIRRAIFHDIDEAETGDIPATVKGPYTIPEELIALAVKVADVIETRTWLQMWGHPSAVERILADNDPRFGALLDALEGRIAGARAVALKLESDIRSGD